MPDLPRDQLDSYQPPEPSADLVDRIMNAVGEQDRSARKGARARSMLRRLAIAAALVAVVLGALLIWRGVDDSGRWRSIRADSKQSLSLGERATAVVESGASLRWKASDDGTTVVQRRGAVMYLVRKGGPFVVNVPGGSVQVVGTRFRVEVTPMKTTKSRIKRGAVGAAALAVVAVAVYQGKVLLGNSEGEVALAAGDEGRISPGERPRRSPRAARARAPASRTKGPAWARRFASAQARQELLRIIHAARRRRERASPAPPSTSSGQASAQLEAPRGVLPKEYIRATINEAIPLVKECYELSLHERPDLSGKLIAEFTILGEEDAGGLVALVDITGEDAVARHQPLEECIRETIYSLEFPRPEGGGQVKVRYPFVFRARREKGR
jgi:ferric-dicitrate binding protein FerR (iron transport regulator)